MIEMINVDVHEKVDPLNEVESYLRGRQRIDYVLATKRVAESVVYARRETIAAGRKVRGEMKKQREKNFIKNLSSHMDPDKAKKQKQTTERQRSQFRQIKESLRKKSTGCIAHIVVPEPEIEYPYNPEGVKGWKEIYDPKEVEEELLRRSRAHFGQAVRTPLR